MKQTQLDPIILRRKAAEYERLAKKHYDLARAIEKSGLYVSPEAPAEKTTSKRSAAWRKQQSEKLKKYWAQKREENSGKK
ncbi:MAG: hypothetical protein KCHDKBKB_01000 [Elusimicrobia bacterium]|nr:hypothetical protein [Elusimicrobiota bacterium]